MKETIREELKEKYVRCVLVNDNALLIYTQNEIVENRLDIKVRYVERNTIQEQYLTSMSKKDFQINRKSLIEINEDRDAIAIFKEKEKGFQLDRLYSLEEHNFSCSDYIDYDYQKKFPNNHLSIELIKKRG